MSKEKVGYADAMAEIETTINQIENSSLDVDQLAEKVKRVTNLIEQCKGTLLKTEQEVNRVFNSDSETETGQDSK